MATFLKVYDHNTRGDRYVNTESIRSLAVSGKEISVDAFGSSILALPCPNPAGVLPHVASAIARPGDGIIEVDAEGNIERFDYDGNLERAWKNDTKAAA